MCIDSWMYPLRLQLWLLSWKTATCLMKPSKIHTCLNKWSAASLTVSLVSSTVNLLGTDGSHLQNWGLMCPNPWGSSACASIEPLSSPVPNDSLPSPPAAARAQCPHSCPHSCSPEDRASALLFLRKGLYFRAGCCLKHKQTFQFLMYTAQVQS
jgi:hypothetical protein